MAHGKVARSRPEARDGLTLHGPAVTVPALTDDEATLTRQFRPGPGTLSPVRLR